MAAHRRLTKIRAAALVLSEATWIAVAGYLGAVTAAAWWAKWRGRTSTPVPSSPTTSFGVLIPAHNEEQLVGSALASIAALDYPPELFQAHVVADNCTDGTVSVVRAHGAEVHERFAPADAGKGPALDWALERLRACNTNIDAIVIIDADTLISPNFLRVADAMLRAGSTVIQGYYAVREPDGSPAVAFRAAALAVRHYLRPLGRNQLGGSAGLHGNGMVFAAQVLETHRWSNHLTEDIELQLELLLDGTRVAFAPDAVVEAEMPLTVEASRTQHERWERGRVEMSRKYLPQLVQRAVRSPNGDRIAFVDAAFDQVLPPFSVTAALSTMWTAAMVVAALTGRVKRRRAVIGGGVTTVQVAYVLSGLLMVSRAPTVYQALRAAPRMVAWKLAVFARTLRRSRQVAWQRTTRNAHDAVPPTYGLASIASPARVACREQS